LFDYTLTKAKFCLWGIIQKYAIVAIVKLEWQARKTSQATIENKCHDLSNIACSCHLHMGALLHTHPVHGKLHIQHHTDREVATL